MSSILEEAMALTSGDRNKEYGHPKDDFECTTTMFNAFIAHKYTEKGEIASSFSKKGKEIVFKVRDSGIGIDRKKMGLIFEKFRQADESTTKRFSGVGLGLYNARKMIDLLEGRIDVVSPVLDNNSGKAEKGTEFIVTLPN